MRDTGQHGSDAGVDEMAVEPAPNRVQLFVVRGSPNSRIAETNLRSFLAAHPELRTEVETIDVADQPALSLAAGVFVTPTLVRIAGERSTVAVGNLQDPRALLELLS